MGRLRTSPCCRVVEWSGVESPRRNDGRYFGLAREQRAAASQACSNCARARGRSGQQGLATYQKPNETLHVVATRNNWRHVSHESRLEDALTLRRTNERVCPAGSWFSMLRQGSTPRSGDTASAPGAFSPRVGVCLQGVGRSSSRRESRSRWGGCQRRGDTEASLR